MQNKYDKEMLIAELQKTFAAFADEFTTIDAEKINRVPASGGWTAGELMNHVTKASNGVPQLLLKQSKKAARYAGEKIEQFKEIMLNFSSKMQSPDFIIPDKRTYDKDESIAGLKKNAAVMPDAIRQAELDEVVEGLPMGEVTRLELMYFMLYHTQRHLHQLKKIHTALSA